MVWASWNLACGGHAGLNRCVRFQSAAKPPAAVRAATERSKALPGRFIASGRLFGLVLLIAGGRDGVLQVFVDLGARLDDHPVLALVDPGVKFRPFVCHDWSLRVP